MNVKRAILGATSNPYRYKDALKFAGITKFIGRGSDRSSTNAYAEALKDIANTGEYVESDIVGVSVEGRRTGRLTLPCFELQKAVDAKATIITDTAADRSRAYNCGERETERFLVNSGYRENSGLGRWDHVTNS